MASWLNVVAVAEDGECEEDQERLLLAEGVIKASWFVRFL